MLDLLHQGQSAHVKGIYGSFPSVLASVVFSAMNRSILVVMPDEEEAAYLHSDLQSLIGVVNSGFLPASFKRPFQVQLPDNVAMQERSELLLRLEKSQQPLVTVTYPEALAEKVISQEEMAANQRGQRYLEALPPVATFLSPTRGI